MEVLLRTAYCRAPPDRSRKDRAMKTTPPIPFAGSTLAEERHVCAFFNSADEQYRVLLPFIKDGFTCGHKAVHVVNPDKHKDHIQRLTTSGIDTQTTQRS